jgi:hypothetical protein
MVPIAWKPTVEAKQALEAALLRDSSLTRNGTITQAIVRCYLQPGVVLEAERRRHVSLEEIEGLAVYLVREAWRRAKRGDSERDEYMKRAAKKAIAAAPPSSAAAKVKHSKKPSEKAARVT